MNKTTLVGNITKDIELRYTPGGKAVIEFSIAVAQYKDDNGDWISDFFNVVAWNKLAENSAQSLSKGSRVIVVGKLYVENWTDKNNNKRQSVKVRAENIGPDLSFAIASVVKNSKEGKAEEEVDFTNEDIPF